MLKSAKKTVVQDLAEVYNKKNAVVITHYHGLTVNDLYTLRTNLKKVNAKFKIVKNTLAKIAANDVGLDNQLHAMFTGPVGIAYSNDPLSISKAIVAFAKQKPALKVVGGIIDRAVVDKASISQLATLPSLEEARSKFLNLLLTPARQLTYLVQQYAEGKQK